MSELAKKGVLTWMRYLYNTFATVESKERISVMLNIWNAQQKTLHKITYECEENFCIYHFLMSTFYFNEQKILCSTI